MERYELVDQKSAKFWEIRTDKLTLTVTFGRIGTQGQTRTKSFDTLAAVAAEKSRLVKEKTGKGYVHVPNAPSAPGGPSSAAVMPAEPAQPAAAVEAVVPEPAMTATQEQVHPGSCPDAAVRDAQARADAFLASMEIHAFPTRCHHQYGIGLFPSTSWDKVRRAALAGLTEKGSAEDIARVEAFLGDDGPVLLDGVTEAAHSSGNAEVIRDAEWLMGVGDTLDILRRKLSNYYTNWTEVLTSFCLWRCERKGVERVFDLLFHMIRLQQARGSGDVGWLPKGLCLALRDRTVSLSEEAYDAALSVCMTEYYDDSDWNFRAHLAFIFADDRPAAHQLQAWPVLQDATAGESGAELKVGSLTALLGDIAPSRASPWYRRNLIHYSRYTGGSSTRTIATLIAVARRHNESAFPALTSLFDHGSGYDLEKLTALILAADEEKSPREVIPFLFNSRVAQGWAEALQLNPVRAFRQCLLTLATGSEEPHSRTYVMDTVLGNPPERLRKWVGDSTKLSNTLERFLKIQTVFQCGMDQCPPILRDPPWHKAQTASKEIVVDCPVMATDFHCAPFTETVRTIPRYQRHPVILQTTEDLIRFITEASQVAFPAWRRIAEAPPLPTVADGEERAISWLAERMMQIYQGSSWDFNHSEWTAVFSSIDLQPEALALALWDCPGPVTALKTWPDMLSRMLARFQARALPGLIRQIEANAVGVFELIGDVDAGEIAPSAARAFFKLKKSKVLAEKWLCAHRTTAITRLIPDAIGPFGPARDAAEYTLRWMLDNSPGAREEIDRIAAVYARTTPAVAEAMAQFFLRDPLSRYPSRIRKPPAWFVPGAIARPQLKGGAGALPDEAITHIVEMLTFSTRDAVYPGLELVRAACTTESLEAFVWDLFLRWLAAGAPAKENWAMFALGWLGQDDCARKLASFIRKWPGESAHARAVTGLDVLLDIGTDVALMHLNGIAEKLKFKGLQSKAREKIAALAEARDMTPEELADRLVPDLDLDENGGMCLDFGPRHFRVGFDEGLRPWIRDAEGRPVKNLPKPGRNDDPELAAEAIQNWKNLKKDARTIAGIQIGRLEAMLASGRRVKPDVFWTFFATHPLLRHLTQRLVWGLYSGDSPEESPEVMFRVADDLSLTDASDDPLTLDFAAEAKGKIGIVHPLQIKAGDFDAWGELFGDYKLVQPFSQLGREVFCLDDHEKSGRDITRFQNIKVSTGHLRGMTNRGWSYGAPQDGGGILWLEYPVRLKDGSHDIASLFFDEGLFAGAADLEEAGQILGLIQLGPDHNDRRGQAPTQTFNDVDALAASELLRSVTVLAHEGGI